MSRISLARISHVVPDIDTAAEFYEQAFGWTRVIDSVLEGETEFPPIDAGEEHSAFRVAYLSDDGETPRVGFLQYLTAPLEQSPNQQNAAAKTSMAEGDVILAIETDDVDDAVARGVAAGGRVARPAAYRSFPHFDGKTAWHQRIGSLFDPFGIYIEFVQDVDESVIREHAPELLKQWEQVER